MTEDRFPVDLAGQAAAPLGKTRAACGAGPAGAVIMVVGRDADARQDLCRELSRRYGADYRIVVCGEPAELERRARDLLAGGIPIALVIGGVGAADPHGIDVLAAIRAVDRTVPRVAAVHWGEWETARPIFDAITTGKADHWVTRPVQSPDEVRAESLADSMSDSAECRS